VINGETGFLAQSDAELSERLDLLAGVAGLRRSFAAAAVRHANQFDWEDITRRWAEVFQQAVENRQLSRQQRAS